MTTSSGKGCGNGNGLSCPDPTPYVFFFVVSFVTNELQQNFIGDKRKTLPEGGVFCLSLC